MLKGTKIFYNPDTGAGTGGELDEKIIDNKGTSTGNPPVDAPPTPAAPDANLPKFTQAQLDEIIRERLEKNKKTMLKEFGIEETENIDLKEIVSKWKEDQEKNKSNEDKLNDKIKEYEENQTSLKSKIEEYEAKFIAYNKGISGDKLDKVVRLASAYDGDTFEDKLNNLIKDIPELAITKEEDKKLPNISKKTNDESISELEAFRLQLRQGMNRK